MLPVLATLVRAEHAALRVGCLARRFLLALSYLFLALARLRSAP
jgi:hypothetical protein